ncbi:hypothetical protein C1H46_042208 [Malus baccata]|uniref:Response regulatory domain-containing protein n=1 Tax=Malus baccata TaxID=106549 RepID=A0A540KDF7_MALBA|nr:hypothetical protein C1H46_042208 [Malus baccata]
MGLGWKDDEKPHVLAVDDSLVDRKIIEKLLTNSACKVTTAENAHGALELLGLADGQQNFGNIDSPTVKEIPVVVVSSEDIPTRIEKCLEEGAEEFFLKPLRQSDIIKLQCRLKEFGDPSDEGEDDLYKDI